MGQINILSTDGTHKAGLSFTGTSDISIDAGNLISKIGNSSSNPAESALQIKMMTGTSTDGLYWIKVNNVARQVYCDMNTAGGGWMLFASKTTPSFVPMNGAFDSDCMSVIGDKHGHIPGSFRSNYKQVLFKFRDHPQGVIHDISIDIGSNINIMTNGYEGTSVSAAAFQTYGYRKTIDNITWSNTISFAGQYFQYSNGISEDHASSDKIMDLYNSSDPSNLYDYSDNVAANGTKCLAGYCYLNDPVLFMFR